MFCITCKLKTGRNKRPVLTASFIVRLLVLELGRVQS
jgi:hypothetical protein